MRRALPLVAAVLVAAALWVTRGSAGPEKIAFPAGWEKFVLYNTVDRYDIKQYRELYASSQEAVDAAKAGKPLPHGTVLALIQYKAQLDAQGNPTTDPKGRFLKGDPVAITVMEKRAGGGPSTPTTFATASGNTLHSRSTGSSTRRPTTRPASSATSHTRNWIS